MNELFFEVHQGLPREGPGDDASTGRAFTMLKDLPPRPAILDIGCGPGMQTLALARLSAGPISAVDTHQPFLEVLKQHAAAAGLAERITTYCMSMAALDFPDQSFDLLWSEGAIYIMGFAAGLAAWRHLLRPGGYVAVTECSWLKPAALPLPEPLRQFWAEGYPAMQSVAANVEIARQQGYQVVGHFTLPDSSWIEHYYTPMAARLAELRQKYANNPDALRHLDEEQLEIDIFHQYSTWYGYVFYILQLD